jgi:hypothetical protein
LFRNRSHRFRQSLAFVDAFYRIYQDTVLLEVAGNDLRGQVMTASLERWARLTVSDLIRAAEDEIRGEGHSNLLITEVVRHGVGILRKRQGNVFSASRLKDKMWGRVIVWSLPSLLLCITISTDNNNVVESVFGVDAAREFAKRSAHSLWAEESNSDPFLLTRMLKTCTRATVEDLLGFKSRVDGTRTSDGGIFGKVRGFLGSVTGDGQGKLTMNLVVWLMGAPTLSQMTQSLRSREFREKVERYIESVARGEPSIEDQKWDGELKRADELQRHSCSTKCAIYRCTRERSIQKTTTVKEDGTWQLVRTTTTYDTYSRSISRTLGVKQRLHFFTNGPATRHDGSRLGQYLGAPAVSRVDISTIISAVLGDVCRMTWLPGRLDKYCLSARILGAVLIGITQQNEIPTEMKIIWLMGSNDYLSSHPSKTINWHMLQRTLLHTYEELRR